MTTEDSVNSPRKSAIVVGVLFIIATAFLFIGESFYKSILSSPDYLDLAYPQRTTLIIGLLLEFTCVLAIPLIPVFLFPVLRKQNEPLALGYVVFRLFETVLFVAVILNKLSLISVSENYLNNGGMDASYFRNFGNSIQSWNDWAWLIYVMVFTLGALMLYFVLYQSKLIPRFISGWGFVAASLLLTGIVLSMFEVNLTLPEGVFELIFAAPIAVQEMVMAIWLIVKGFNPAAITSDSVSETRI